MRRSRPNNPKGEGGGDGSSPMVVGTGVTMDYSAVDNPSLDVSGRPVLGRGAVCFLFPFFFPSAAVSLNTAVKGSRLPSRLSE